MKLVEKLNTCKEEEVDAIIEEEIKTLDSKASKVGTLGFLSGISKNNSYNGFIPLNTRIRYGQSNMEDYGMETTDFIYEFAHFVKKYDIKNETAIVYNLEYFLLKYFGTGELEDREKIFNDLAWQTTTTDDEYFNKLANNKLGDLKGKCAALCTEYSAASQQILSVFGFDSYYCMGCLKKDDKAEAHCFNVVKNSKGYAVVDYSQPVFSYDENGNFRSFYPFIGQLSEEEFSEFMGNQTIKEFDDYHFENRNQKTIDDKTRKYVVGAFELKDEKTL